jgi:hypothetical protein
LLCLLVATAAIQAAGPPIRLRNETILPGASRGLAEQGAVAANSALTGLFLVQFEGPLGPAEREALRTAGVDLIKYVPYNAYIAKLNQVAPRSILQFGFVRWVGPYRPDHKIHPRLAALASTQPQTNLAVNILLSTHATRTEIALVRALLATIHHESHLRQGTVLRGEMSPPNLQALAQSSAVLWIERAPRRRLVDEQASKLVGGDDGRSATPTVTEQIGFGGAGVTVCVADTGLDTGDTNTMHPDLRGRVTGFRYYGSLSDGSDGYGHGTHCAGIVAGNAATGETDTNSGALYGLGVASHANLFIERIFDENANQVSPFPSDENLTQDAVRNGAQIGSNSWGDDVNGEYDLDASQFDELVRDADTGTPGDQPYILEFSAGNAGPDSQSIDSPASGKNVLATGASENVAGTPALSFDSYADGPDTMCDFSSRGPCEDGRLKPDIVAPGSWIASAASSAAPNLAAIAWPYPIDNYYVYMGGTSMSGPAAAGAAADFVQYYKSTHTNAIPSPALVKAALINSAEELDESNGGPGPIPNNDEGWGRITLTNIITTNAALAPRLYQYLDQSVLLTTGQNYAQHAFVHSSAQPLKITLVYTDVAGFPGAIPALVNDLDLEVVGPDGTLYRGNQIAIGESIPNPRGADAINNVEAVHLAQPLPGDYLVRVVGKSIVEDARLDTAAIDQDFALVVSGDLLRAGTGLLLLDRTNYTAPSIVQIEVLDQARAASNTVSVTLKSATEPAGEIYTLHTSGNYGAFTSTVATVVGSAAADGKLEIHNSDSIEADYLDSSSTTRVALATAQFIPPVLTSVAATNDLGIIAVVWQTSEPANSIVRYSTNLSFNLAITNSTLMTAHAIKLLQLVPGTTYYFYVVSIDAAGNTTTNNNSGAYYSFVAVPTPALLLVDDYDGDGEAADGSTVIPDSSYTNALAAAGFSFSFWKVTQRGEPQLFDLQGFPIVMWRTTDDIINYTGTHNTLTPQQQFMIQGYLDGGGSFFMASMSILQQLGAVSFRHDVLQVARFKSNPDPPAPCSECDEDFGVPTALGQPSSPVTSGMNLTLDYSNYPPFDDGLGDIYGPDFSDTFTATHNATPIFFESVSGRSCGISYPANGIDSPGRVVFLSFPLDAVPTSGTAPNNETVLLRNALNFLAPGANGAAAIFLDQTVYTSPDQVAVEVGDTRLIGAGQTSATLSTSSSNRLTLTLFETAHPGLFRGVLGLVTTNATTNQLVVKNGDILTAVYFDAFNHSNTVATAAIDTVPPIITQVSSSTRFADATVTWATSKPANSLVQYGESVLLGRTASSPLFVTNHSVSISGLSPNRVYYYDVVSRDAAGNTTVNDNQGKLYTLTTLAAPRPPWSDNLETGATNWSVVPDPSGTDINWQLGTPHNGLQASAHSGTNAWGSNLKGQNFNIASTFLYSPVIDLSGMSKVTLTFWDSFDFTSGFEDGQLGISTNSSTPPANVPTLVDYSGQSAPDWQQETVDLTSYAGQAIQVVWYYQGASFGSTPSGWLLDDVSITGISGGGTIIVTKNLAEGTFSMAGPVSQYSGTGLTTTISNAAPGQYMIEFDDVAFYKTPPPQTNNLILGATINFDASYTFIDLNHNSISDAWEMYYFGVVSTNRTQNTDTDGDGMTDYAEFIAGTNPTNAASNLKFLSASLQTNRLVKFQWSAIPGRIYQVQTSTNLQAWSPLTDWLQAKVSPMTYVTTNSASGAHLYRVQVRP